MSASAIGWIVSIIFVIILVIGFFVGFWRGLKRSTANLVFSVIGIIVAFFVTPVITNAIMGIQIDNNGKQVSLSQAIIEALKEDETISAIITRNPNMESFIEALPAALANVVVFLLVTCVIELLTYIVYRIIACFTFKTQEGESKHRWWGAGVGLVKTFLLTIFAFMPLAGLVGVYGTAKNSNEMFVTNSEVTASSLLDEVPPEVDEILTGLENNALIKICGIFGLDNATFDYYSQVKVDSNTIYLRKELKNLYPIANMTYQIVKTDEYITFNDVDYDKLEKYVNNFTEGGLFKGIIVDLANDIIQNYQEYPFISKSENLSQIQEILAPIQTKLQEYSQNHDMLEQYFTHDVKYIFQTVKTAAQNGIIDEIMSMPQTTTLEHVIDTLTNDKNIVATETTLSSVLDINLVRDAIAPLTEMLLDEVKQSVELEPISVDTSSWGEQDWDKLSSSVVNVLKDYSDLSDQVDIIGVVEDPSLLISDESIDIENITSSLGKLLDEARSIKLFYNANEESIIDNLLANYNISLPDSAVFNAEGQAVEIEKYSELFEFITPSLTKIKENNLYDVLNNSQDTLTLMSQLAEVLSQDGKENLLSEIVLPLSQVEPTKTFVVEEMLQTIQNNVVDFTSLTSYQDWKNDLGQISDLLVTLNSLTLEDVTYLELAINGDVQSIINNLTEVSLASVVKPVLYAKSTSSLRDELFTSITDVVDRITSVTNTIDLSGITLAQNNNEDQADEICNILADFLELNKVYSEGMGLRDIDKTLLGEFLTSMQQNAYRQTLLAKQEAGAFKSVYDNILTTIKTEYQDVIALSSDLQQMLDEENYPYIDFTALFDLIAELESL